MEQSGKQGIVCSKTDYCQTKQRLNYQHTNPCYEQGEAKESEELTDNQKTLIIKITRIKMMMRTMRAKMEMNNTRESKAVDMKNKNKETYKGNRESTISQAKIKETIATEIGIKSGKEKGNTRINPKETKHKVT